MLMKIVKIHKPMKLKNPKRFYFEKPDFVKSSEKLNFVKNPKYKNKVFFIFYETEKECQTIL